jgi:serine phosphatase RsbU (regulator of sigma subunit)/anti-sigma regulatory factor (Ser/Thr protein kinase)
LFNPFSGLLRGPIIKTFEMEVPAREQHLGEIRDFITDIAAQAGFSLHEVNNLKLALDEACSNVVRHAYKDMELGTINLKVYWRERELEIAIKDRGKGFDWKGTRAPDLNRYVDIGKKGGLGIWFIRRLMDKTDYTSTPQGNTLRLIKYIKTPAAAAALETEAPAAAPAVPGAIALPPSAAEARSRISVKIKYLLPVVASVAILVLVIFAYMFRNQDRVLRQEILTSASETSRRMANEAVNYMFAQDDLHLATLVKNAVRTDPKLAYAFILNNDNNIWAHSRTQLMFRPFQAPPGFKSPTGRAPLSQDWTDPALGTVHDIGVPVFLGDLRLGAVHLGVKEKAIREEIDTGRKHAALIFLIALVLSTSGAYWLMTFIVAPIQKLSDGMLAISEGKLNHRIMIRSNDEFGQIAKIFNEMTHRFSEAQSHLLEQERIQQEMQVAQEIQHTLLPREVPEIEGYDVASMYRSAKEVGGDYFDFMLVNDNMLGITVADVSGKGVPGSLVMTMIRTALRLEARGNRSAIDVLDKVNAFVTPDMKKGMFVTMFYIILDSRQRIINFGSAGHNPMILYREETDRIYYLKPRGFPLGIDLPDPGLFAKSLTQENVRLKQGDILLAYTDGITEAMNPRREQFGEQRLIKAIREGNKLSATEFVDKLSDELAAFTEDYPQNDDITCVVIKEKMMADTVQINLRRKLFYLVDKQGLSVAEACRQLALSTSTYYRLKRIRDRYGDRGLLQVTARSESQILQLAQDERQRLLTLVIAQPELGAKRLAQLLAEPQHGALTIPEKNIYQELKRLRLSTRAARSEYSAKKRLTSLERL